MLHIFPFDCVCVQRTRESEYTPILFLNDSLNCSISTGGAAGAASPWLPIHPQHFVPGYQMSFVPTQQRDEERQGVVFVCL